MTKPQNVEYLCKSSAARIETDATIVTNQSNTLHITAKVTFFSHLVHLTNFASYPNQEAALNLLQKASANLAGLETQVKIKQREYQ